MCTRSLTCSIFYDITFPLINKFLLSFFIKVMSIYTFKMFISVGIQIIKSKATWYIIWPERPQTVMECWHFSLKLHQLHLQWVEHCFPGCCLHWLPCTILSLSALCLSASLLANSGLSACSVKSSTGLKGTTRQTFSFSKTCWYIFPLTQWKYLEYSTLMSTMNGT